MLKFNEIPKNSFILFLTRKLAEAKVHTKDIKVPIEYKETPEIVFCCCKIVEDGFLVDLENKEVFSIIIPDSPQFREALNFELRSHSYTNINFLQSYIDRDSLLGIRLMQVYFYDGEKVYEVSYD